MGLRDDDANIYADRDLLDWAKQAPERPGDYDHPASEEEQAAYEYASRKHRERKPKVKRYADED